MLSKTNLISLFGSAAVTLAVCSVSQAAPAPRFPTSAGRVVYSITNTGAAPMRGTIEMRWAQGGQRFRQDMNLKTNAQGRSLGVKTWTIFDGKSMYVSSPQMSGAPQSVSRSVFRMKLPPDYLSRMGAGMMPGGAKMNQGKVVGRGSILGKPCVVRVATINTAQAKGRIKVWAWQNLPLRTEMDMNLKSAPGGKGPKMPPMHMTMVATKLDSSSAAPTLFRLPRGVSIQDIKVPVR